MEGDEAESCTSVYQVAGVGELISEVDEAGGTATRRGIGGGGGGCGSGRRWINGESYRRSLN
jgi:hypothetical protein